MNIRNSKLMKQLFDRINPYKLGLPIEHFYSPIPSKEDIRTGRKKSNVKDYHDGIDLNSHGQIDFFNQVVKFYLEYDFPENSGVKYRYFSKNEMYGLSSSILLFCVINHIRPKKIIEVGSGYTSALMLDTNNNFLNNEMHLTFIEPYPTRLKKLLREKDIDKITILENRVQDVDSKIFATLEENDILFIDGSHISKMGSDVNTLLFEVLPKLKKGVKIHIHDIFYPWEYPEVFQKQGIYWNELYLLRAFLQFNDSFKIDFFNTYFIENHEELLINYPKFTQDIGGCLWISKIK